ncbi:MAG: T9SS type A sorting domain-containing protein [Bacteroidetes bacterium]|nr:T9SS type A sorting domain-containing protein [Bacteroidota bacterium]
MGNTQYQWLKNTLKNSTEQYKFVFAHHTRGEGRGGILTARYYEWGGYEADSITWGFTANRQGWAKPIHQLFVDNGVNIFFQVSLINTLGQTILQTKSTNFNISGIKNGIYFLHIKTSNFEENKKIIIYR